MVNHLLAVLLVCGLILVDCGAAMSDDILIDKALHRKLAIQTHGDTWKLLEKGTLSEDDRDQILYLVFASAYHWSIAGDVVNKQRAEWLISRVYIKLERAEVALFHAQRCLALTESNTKKLKDFDLAFALEAMARSHALSGNRDEAENFYHQAVEAGKLIKDEEDKKVFFDDLKGGNWNGEYFSTGK